MVPVDFEKLAVVGGAILVVSTLFLLQKHTTPHPRRHTRRDGPTALHAALPGDRQHRTTTTARAGSQSRSRPASSHRSRREHRVKPSTAPEAAAAALPAQVSPPSVPTDSTPITPLTVSALHTHRQREGKVKAVEAHLEGAVALVQGGAEPFATVSNAATTGTNQNGDMLEASDATGQDVAAETGPSHAHSGHPVKPHGSSSPHSRKHSGRPRTAWKPPADAPVPDTHTDTLPPPLSVPLSGSTAALTRVPAAAAPSGASPTDRAHSSLHLSDLGFSPITPASQSRVLASDGSPLLDRWPAAPCLPASLGVLLLIEEEVNALVHQVEATRGSAAAWMALYVFVHQVPTAPLQLCRQSSGLTTWQPVLAGALPTDPTLAELAQWVMARLEDVAVATETPAHYEWASRECLAVVVKSGKALSAEQRQWCLLLPHKDASTLRSHPSRHSRATSPSRFAAFLIDSSSSSSSAVEREQPHRTSSSLDSAKASADFLASLAHKYRYLADTLYASDKVVGQRRPPTTPLTGMLAESVDKLSALQDTAAFAKLRHQSEYAAFARDFVEAVGQLQQVMGQDSLVNGDTNRSTANLPATLRKPSVPSAAGPLRLRGGTDPSLNLSHELREAARDAPSRPQSSSRLGTDGVRSPLTPHKPQSYYRALSTSALQQEPVSPPTSRTVPAKTGQPFGRSRTEQSASLSRDSPSGRKDIVDGAARINVFERLYTPPKKSPKSSPAKRPAKAAFTLYA